LLSARIGRLTVVIASVAGLGLAGSAVPAQAAARPAHVRGTETVPVYDYATAIRESVWVDTPLDNDRDGVPDRVVVDLVRPREAAQAGGKAPVIMDASPYYKCCGRGNESEKKQYATDGTVNKFPLFYDNFFVPRGYAFAAVDLAGTNRSTGCGDTGGPEEIASVKAAVDWLNGRATGRHADGSPAVAGWTTGKVGMIGKSWDGTLANGVAATGVAGLTTIVPISAISSWYDYYRSGGTLYTADFGAAWLAGFVNGRPAGVCGAVQRRLKTGEADATGNFNAFWSQRDYVKDARNVRASVFVVHGLNDLNVQTNHFAQWWDTLAARGVPRKIWLSQEGHVDPFDFRRGAWVDTLHRWFDFWLQGLPNGIMNEPMATVERSADRFVDEPTWPAAGARPVPVALGPGNGTTGTLDLRPAPAAGAVRTVTDNPALTETDATATPTTARAGRLVFLSAALPRDVRLSGTASITLRIRANRSTTGLTAKLVDYGTATRVDYLGAGEGIHNLTTQSCWGPATATDDACYFDTARSTVTADRAVLTRGWVDAAHRNSLTNPTPLTPGRWASVTWKLRAQDAVLPAGHVLGLVVTLTDNEFTTPLTTGATVDVDLGGSRLDLPITAAGRPLADAATAPQLDAAPAPAPGRQSGRFETFR